MRRDPQTVVITGAGSGIGAALAVNAARSGWRPILVGRRPDALARVAAGLPERSGAITVSADITKQEGRHLIKEACDATGGRLDMLINNAGVVSTGGFAEMSGEAISAMIDTNLAAPIVLTQDLLGCLQKTDAPRIVNIGSMFGDIAFPLFSVYSTTKFGLRGFSEALRRELASQGIGVTYAAPRAVKTPAADGFDDLIEPFQMKLDAADKVAGRIWTGALKGKRSIYPRGPEILFLLLQRLAPTLIDGGLIKQYRNYQENL